MAGQEHRRAPFPAFMHQFQKPVLHQRVQSAGGFVQNQDFRLCQKSVENAQLLFGSLAHAANPLLSVQLKKVGQTLGFRQVGNALHSGHEPQKLLAGHVVGQCQFSGKIPHMGLNFFRVPKTVHSQNSRAAFLGPDKPHQLPDGGGFSCTVGS